ncbi:MULTISPECIES: TRAP transporter TatT component family protein [unclassified Anaeromyxobacter]|uniref:TRAP transporter TatT component family protein n=1 Tax=unclassified Anaeromyxobacter TaxID=2620896 RepID=UPI001F580ACF|nr:MULTISPECIES: TRAP transporter TatT component family protein [unclassified Anaeromyxobacter]
MKRLLLVTALSVTAASLTGCRSTAMSFVSDAVAQSGSAYGSDDDPELVREAVPFGLKTMEGLLSENPEHEGLLRALAGNFTQYAYAFVQSDADRADLDGNLDAARAGRERARKLYLRARDYGLRALEERHEHLSAQLREGRDLAKALKRAEKRDVEALYWTASAWTLAIANGKGDMALVAELPIPVAMMERALALDERWGEGALHEYFVSLDAARGEHEGGGPARAKAHLDRALELSLNKKLGPRVAYAEGTLVKQQDRAAFERELEEVLRANAEEVPKYRLANILAQRRARVLLDHVEDLFL